MHIRLPRNSTGFSKVPRCPSLNSFHSKKSFLTCTNTDMNLRPVRQQYMRGAWGLKSVNTLPTERDILLQIQLMIEKTKLKKIYNFPWTQLTHYIMKINTIFEAVCRACYCESRLNLITHEYSLTTKTKPNHHYHTNVLSVNAAAL